MGEAYERSFKPLHATKIKSDSSNIDHNAFLFEGTTLYPTAVRIYPMRRSANFNKLIFIDSGYQEITLIKKDSSYAIKSGTAIEDEHKKFLSDMGIKTIDDEIDSKKLLAYVQKHPDSYVALFAVINQADRYPYPAIFNKINDAFGEKIKQTKAFEYYTNKYDPKSTATADPDLLGTSIEGKQIRLSDFKGKSFVLLDFWATWCAPCLKMMPHLKELYQKYHSKGLEIISIGSSLSDSKDAWEKTMRKEGMESWINLFSEPPYTNGPDLGIKYGITAIPATILIDREGNIAGRYVDYSADNKPSSLDKKLSEIFR
jgi:thiol-disulfide isomerase/thioredoxin